LWNGWFNNNPLFQNDISFHDGGRAPLERSDLSEQSPKLSESHPTAASLLEFVTTRPYN
jgi:hypothetical protein